MTISPSYPSENALQITEFLEQFKNDYGTPIALVHDMGSAILKAVRTVFPGCPDYICHFHFLKDIGKDLLDRDYSTIRRHLKTHRVRTHLRQMIQLVQPQRTNNIMEQFFIDLKRNYRKKNGNNSLTKILQTMMADTTLVKNLNNPQYMKIILDGKLELAELFSDIDIKQVHKAFKQEQQTAQSYPKRMRKLLKRSDLLA